MLGGGGMMLGGGGMMLGGGGMMLGGGGMMLGGGEIPTRHWISFMPLRRWQYRSQRFHSSKHRRRNSRIALLQRTELWENQDRKDWSMELSRKCVHREVQVRLKRQRSNHHIRFEKLRCWTYMDKRYRKRLGRRPFLPGKRSGR